MSGAPGRTPTLAVTTSQEQKSLMSAVDIARREVVVLSAAESAMPRNAGVRFFASNPGQQITVRFRDGEVEFGAVCAGHEWSGTLRLAGLNGRSVNRGSTPRVRNHRVEYAHDSVITEWFENRPEGIEHGYTLASRPGGMRESGELRLEVSLTGMTACAPPAPEKAGCAAWMKLITGEPVIRYDHLQVWDSRGTVVPARIEAHGSGISICIADAGSVYPLTIDPLITRFDAKWGPEVTGDGNPEDQFGKSVALDGDTALVGASGDDTPTGSGSCYVFVRDGIDWHFQAKLTPGDSAMYDDFGAAVALSNGTAVVGVPARNLPNQPQAGSAYIFVREGTSWRQQAKLTPSDAGAGDYFGQTVALSGETALIGAKFDDTAGGTDAGSVYVFRRAGDSWTQQARLTAADGAAGDRFGCSVALAGTTALVGASMDDTPGFQDAGGAYVFTSEGGNWLQLVKLIPANPSLNGEFGRSVALSGDTALVGSPGDITPAGVSAGSAFVFIRNGSSWVQQAKLNPSDAAGGQSFGNSVALEDATAFIGTELRSQPEKGYIFEQTGQAWAQRATLSAGLAGNIPAGGSTVALSGNTAVIGVFSDYTEAGKNAGTAMVFMRNGNTWGLQEKLSAGDGASYDWFGVNVALADHIALVSAYKDDTAAGTDAGSVYVLERSESGWDAKSRLTAGDASDGDFFGSSVALSGSTAIVGAPRDTSGTYPFRGTAYVFARSADGWIQQAKLTPAEAFPVDYFGTSVALSGDTALVGATEGRAYVFVRNGTVWSREAALEGLGTVVSLDGDTALVGSPGAGSPVGFGVGHVYVYVRTAATWTEQAIITNPHPDNWDAFGGSVALSGETALIGTSADDTTAGSDAGSAYVFVRNGSTWSQQARLMASDAASSDFFGGRVALSGDTALIGASLDDTAGKVDSGSAYVYVRSGVTWAQRTKLLAPDAAVGDRFGWGLALHRDTALVGAYGDSTTYPLTGDLRSEHGSVYVYQIFEGTAEQAAYYAWMPQGTGDSRPESTPFQDGVPNLLKYAFNMNPASPDHRWLVPGSGTSGLPSVDLIQDESGHYLRIEFLRRKGGGLVYTPEKSASLQSWEHLNAVPQISDINASWERVVYEEAVDPRSNPVQFGRVEITLP